MRHLCVIAFALCACGPSKVSHGSGDANTGGDSSIPPAHTLVSLSVTPLNPLLELDLNTPASQLFTVTGSYADDTQEDLTAQATWAVANPAVGAMTTATLAVPGYTVATAVTSKITATVDNLDGIAQITVVAHRPQDFFFILPYQDTAGTMTRPLTFATTVPALDVFFLMDVTGSMTGEISNLQNALVG
ncbi:MAG TPA: hypothetical protein VF403_28180, partial [Kofleriaceae bacterium]